MYTAHDYEYVGMVNLKCTCLYAYWETRIYVCSRTYALEVHVLHSA